MNPLCAQRIDRNDQGERRIDAARQPHHHTREAVLGDIVTGALHQRTVHTLFLALQRHNVGGNGMDHTACIQSQVHDIHSLGKGRRALRHGALRIHDKGIAVKDQLVLAADQIAEHHRNAGFLDPLAYHLLLAHALLIDLVGRGIDDQQHLRTLLTRLARRRRVPGVLAYQNSRPYPVDVEDRRIGTRREIAFFVEYSIVG